METAREILQFLHYHPSSSREDIRAGIDFQESDATLKRLIAHYHLERLIRLTTRKPC